MLAWRPLVSAASEKSKVSPSHWTVAVMELGHPAESQSITPDAGAWPYVAVKSIVDVVSARATVTPIAKKSTMPMIPKSFRIFQILLAAVGVRRFSSAFAALIRTARADLNVLQTMDLRA
jgi:hypothetical protein